MSEEKEIWTDYCKNCGSTDIVNKEDTWDGLCADCGSRKKGKAKLKVKELIE